MLNDKQRILDELSSRIDNIKRERANFPLEGNFLLYTSQINALENFYSWIQTGMRTPKSKQRERSRDNRVQLENVLSKRMRKIDERQDSSGDTKKNRTKEKLVKGCK